MFSLCLCASVVHRSGGTTPDNLEYNRDIRPILAENCFACHGPDSAARKADLRLDRRDDAIKAKAIVPGNPEKSELIERILSDDAEEADAAGEVAQEADGRRRRTSSSSWIADGAEYQPHWSFIAPQAARAAGGQERRLGAQSRSTASSWPSWRSTACSRRPRPTAARWPGGSAST